jgi:serine O-acetyltransferase
LIGFGVILRDPINYFMLLLRFNELSRNGAMVLPLRLIIRFLFRRQSVRLGFSIPPNVFERGLAIVHYGPIIVNSNARVGQECRIHVGVNIGGSAGLVAAEKAKTLVPRIGAFCYIGPGAKIFGPVVVADRCVIGANAVVNKSFQDSGHVIVGNPAASISNRGSGDMIPDFPMNSTILHQRES